MIDLNLKELPLNNSYYNYINTLIFIILLQLIRNNNETNNNKFITFLDPEPILSEYTKSFVNFVFLNQFLINFSLNNIIILQIFRV